MLSALLSGCSWLPDKEGLLDPDGDGADYGEDCDDTRADVFPGAVEVYYDGLDNDCDSATSDGDADGDGFDAALVGGADCDDDDPGSYPSAVDIVDGYDQNCDGVDGTDQDGDGAASEASGGEDCDDTRSNVFPEAAEVCDGVDNDCDGVEEDEEAADTVSWYRDADEDGYGDPHDTTTACEAPEGYVDNALDCDDADPGLAPSAADYTVDGHDQDCDGVDGYHDAACDSALVEMAAIPNGTFTMGSPDEEVGRDSDETEHEVTLTHSYCLGINEMTQGEYTALMGENPSYFSACGDDCPVEQVSWHMAAAFTNALSELEGLDSCYTCTGESTDVACEPVEDPYGCEGYRLPTEAEWERAARGGLVDAAFPSGGSLVDGTEYDCDASLELDDGRLLSEQVWFCLADETHPVGELLSNGYGLHDMSGNVWEWVGDWYDDYGYSEVDPIGSEANSIRVYRGGSWGDVPRGTRLAIRDGDVPSSSATSLGFRPARSLPSSP